MWEIYKQLSTYVGTRNMNQCRIFHCKQMKTHMSILDVADLLKGSCSKFVKIYNQHRVNLETLAKSLSWDDY